MAQSTISTALTACSAKLRGKIRSAKIGRRPSAARYERSDTKRERHRSRFVPPDDDYFRRRLRLVRGPRATARAATARHQAQPEQHRERPRAIGLRLGEFAGTTTAIRVAGGRGRARGYCLAARAPGSHRRSATRSGTQSACAAARASASARECTANSRRRARCCRSSGAPR